MLDEFFVEGEISLESWMLMAKGKIKPSREGGADGTVDHSQTILFLESAETNALYSSMLRRFKECVDECLIPEVSLNSQRSRADQEEWYNSLEPRRRSFGKTYSYMTDIRCFDRSQDQVALKVDIAFYKRHGLDAERLAVWEKAHGTKKALSMMFGLVLWIALSGISGDWKTLFRNGLVNLSAILMSTGVVRGDIVALDIVGDDIDAEFVRPVDVEKTIEGMSLNFNFSAKFFSTKVRYMCKEFRIFLQGRWYFVPDMWARAQSVLTPVRLSNNGDVLAERWESLVHDLRHYQNGVILDAACEAAQAHYGLSRAPYGTARALSLFARSKPAFMNFFKQPERIY
jgi:hypothetical protein